MQASNSQLGSSRFRRLEPWPPSGVCRITSRSRAFLLAQGSRRRSRLKCTILCCRMQHSTNSARLQKVDRCSIDQVTSYLHVQSLRNFPIEKLCGEVVVVRLDSAHLLGPFEPCNLSLKKTLLTIKYLYEARAKVVIITSWDIVLQSNNPVLKSTEAFAEYLSSLLQVGVISVNGAPGLTSVKKKEWVQNDIILFENLRNFKGEVSNCNEFSQKLASDWRQQLLEKCTRSSPVGLSI